LLLIGEIGLDVDPRQVLTELRASAGGDVVVHLDSGGGDAFAGLSLYQLLRDHPGHVQVRVLGLAASAASVIMCGADEVVMSPNSMVMVHEASAMTWGTEDDHYASAALLGKVSAQISQIYAGRTGGDAAVWRDRMKAETWLTSNEAVAVGLADRVAEVPESRSSTRPRAVSQPSSASTGRLAAQLRSAMPPSRSDLAWAKFEGALRRMNRREVPSVMPILRELKATRR
jgi:ATP-dependent protease ClpP protease subunit